MMRQATSVLALAAVLALTAVSGRADDKTTKEKGRDPQGEPTGFKAGSGDGYAVWYNNQGWHLRTTTAKKRHHFKGSIRIEGGAITKIHSHHLEKEGKCEDHWIVAPDKKEVLFDFKTEKGVDGIDFHVSKGAKQVKFELLIDGKHQEKKILIGRGGHHPQHDSFTLAAHPRAKK
jgi:hypothetical protein